MYWRFNQRSLGQLDRCDADVDLRVHLYLGPTWPRLVGPRAMDRVRHSCGPLRPLYSASRGKCRGDDVGYGRRTFFIVFVAPRADNRRHHNIVEYRCAVIHALYAHDLFGAPVIEYDTAFVYFRWPSLLTSVAVVVLQMSIFATMGERHNRRLLESNFDAQQSNRAKSAFLASMSHEIRTPMNGVIGLIEMLEHSDLNDDQRRMLRTVRESSFSLLRIIDDILDTSKIEAGRLELKPAPMDLLALVEGVVETMNSFAADRNVQLRLKFESDLPAWITADPGRLRQIFLNLLSNAVKFSSKHPKRSGVVEIIVTHD